MNTIIKKTAIFGCAMMLVLLTSLVLLSPPQAKASFVANKLIDDSIFNKTGSMSIGDINNFLNSFPGSCISPNNGFSSPDPTGYSPSGGFSYGGNVTAGQVIYDAAQAYGLNPQVLLATLQKEQSLVTGSAGCYNEPNPGTATPMTDACGSGTRNCTLACTHAGGCINIAVGYGCPNYCNANDEGFSNQIIHAAWLFKFGQQRSLGNTGWNVQLSNFPQGGDHWDNSDDPSTSYGGPMTQGNLSRGNGSPTTFYDGYTTIDGSSVHMDSGGTAALYWYTPHLSGNQNFVSIFEGWWGSTQDPCGNPNISYGPGYRPSVNGDFDGRARTSATVFRPGDGCWHIRAVGDVQYGQSGDIPVPADYNGDGRTDIAIYRSGNGWHIRGVGDYAYGNSADIPVPGDYNADTRADVAVYRPSDGTWHIRGIGDYSYGQTGDIPVPADYNGDSATDIAVYRPGDGTWHVRGVGDFQYGGVSGDVPVPADYNGDRRADIAIFRPGEGGWHIRAVGDYAYGQLGDRPVPGDYNGDRRADIAIFRPGEGGWHIRAVGDYGYGTSSDIPAVQTPSAILLHQYGLISGY